VKLKFWIVGQYFEQDKWSLEGLYFFKKSAIKACKKDLYFIAPVYLGLPLLEGREILRGCYYPRLEASSRFPE
jgi:hypothetical protein